MAQQEHTGLAADPFDPDNADRIGCVSHTGGTVTRCLAAYADRINALVAENEMLRQSIAGWNLIAGRQNECIGNLTEVVRQIRERTEPLDLPTQMERVGRLLVDMRGGIKS